MTGKGRIERTSKRELMTTHVFDAPRELVWKVWTDSTLIPRWWGPRYLTTTVDTMEFRPGGKWRFVQHDAEGHTYGFHGEYREIVPLEKIVDTFEFEGKPGHVLVESAVFEDIGGKTKVTQKSVFETVEDLEGMLASGMEEGARETMERFTELVAEMKRAGEGGRTADRELVITQVFDATPEVLWSYWTDPAKFAKWFNPAPGLDLVVHEYDVRPGGRVRFDMPQPDGNRNPQDGVFHRLEPFREIVSGAADKSFLIKVTFEPVRTKTRMTVTVSGLPPEFREGATKGWNAGFDKLARSLEAERPGVRDGTAAPPKAGPGSVRARKNELVITRTFDAPRERVWRAWTDPVEMKRWWGPKTFTTPFLSVDLRVGGAFRYCMRSPDGKDYWGAGVFREIVPGKRIVYTDSFTDEKGNVVPATYYGMNAEIPLEMIVTLTFEEEKGQTKVTLHHAGMPPGPDREGATQGWNEMFDKLVEYLGG